MRKKYREKYPKYLDKYKFYEQKTVSDQSCRDFLERLSSLITRKILNGKKLYYSLF